MILMISPPVDIHILKKYKTKKQTQEIKKSLNDVLMKIEPMVNKLCRC